MTEKIVNWDVKNQNKQTKINRILKMICAKYYNKEVFSIELTSCHTKGCDSLS